MSYRISLPFIVVSQNVTGQSYTDTLFDLIKNSQYQRRVRMVRHSLLDLAAQRKAEDLAKQEYWGHFPPNGPAPNLNVRLTGYELPDFYLDNGNNVESLAIGGGKPEDVALAWLTSKKGHRLHVFGDDLFFREQECIGIGIATAKDTRTVSVFYSAPCL